MPETTQNTEQAVMTGDVYEQYLNCCLGALALDEPAELEYDWNFHPTNREPGI